MGYQALLVEIADRVATVTVNRPEKRNALNMTVRSELLAALDALRADDEVRVVVFTGAGGKAFVAGADIAEFAARTPLEQRATMTPPRIFDAIAELPKPTIAMINGLALGGGCELALACDLRLAAASARLGQPEIRLGLIPGGGGTQRLPRLVGYGQALRLVLTGEPIDAAEALRIGMVDAVHEDGELRARTLELAGAMAAHSPVALQLAKQAVRAALELPLAAGLACERELFITAFGSADGREGVSAFLEKRAPDFRGH
ncbi:MAG TPA: enoyl-CoA hydratase-related protein [Longimicrobiales bacterium]|nr:enoyl-CoA hydratase-related protein [Longimicrobiales bacterium]